MLSNKGNLYIVTEALGPSLYDSVIKPRKKLELRQVQQVARQILVALKYFKDKGIIHCDIKPENVLYKNYTFTDVKVIDFGSSVFINDTSYCYLQTRPYRAPELIFGCDFDFAVDMWSLGCVLFEITTFAMLFNNKTLEENIAKMFAVCKDTPLSFFEDGKAYKNLVQENLICRSNRNSSNGYEVEVMLPKTDYTIEGVLKEHEATDELIDFIKRCIVVDRTKRLTVEEALSHSFIRQAL